jgi:hypothetical protein
MTTRLCNNARLKCLLPILLIGCISFTFAQTRAKYRSLDGSNNNLANPTWGAANIPLFRELPAEYADGLNALAGAKRPNPRLISNRISDEKEDIHNRRGLAGLFYSWGQFIDHDMTSTPTGTEKVPIPLPSGESKFTMPISFTRSMPIPGTGIVSPREQLNTSNSWIDASMVYGNDQVTATWLRTFERGKLWVSYGNFLPYNTTNRQKNGTLDPTAPKMDDDRGRTKITFVAGDHRAAEHPGLTSLHNLFVREHNRICDRLISQGYSDDEIIYQTARKEVAALIQIITYNQWLDALGVKLKPYKGYNAAVRPDIANTFSTAAYRWHTMVENDIILRDNECRGVGPVELPLKDVFFNIGVVEKYDIGVILKGLSVHRSYETDVKVNSGLRNFLFGTIGTDLVAINLQRGRDHGLPSYNNARQFYTGSRAYSFSDITKDGYLAGELENLYGNVDNVDLWVGLYAETHLEGKSIGATVNAMLSHQLENLRDGDYYYYLNDFDLVTTQSSIVSTTLGDLIARNSTASNFQSNVFFVKSCDESSNFDDLRKPLCSVTPQFEGWTLVGRTADKIYYKWNGASVDYYEARGLARRIGGSLLTIPNVAENNYVKTFVAADGAWLDMGRDAANQWQYSGVFNAADAFTGGIKPTYYNWRFGEPNNVGRNEKYAQIRPDGLWDDISETTKQMVIAELKCDESPIVDGCFTASYFNNKTLSGVPILVRKESYIDFDWEVNRLAAGVASDNFSVRYDGSFVAPETGIYTFETKGDDGYRLWVNNTLLTDTWNNTNFNAISRTIYLTKGVSIPIKLEYYEVTGNASLRLKWQVPQTYITPIINFTNLKGSYFNNNDLAGTPILVRPETSINFDFGNGSPASGIRSDNFSARYEGKLTTTVAGEYIISVNSDDGTRIWANNQLIFNQWNSVNKESISIYLEAGITIPIKIEYREISGNARCTVKVTAPDYNATPSRFKVSGCPIDPTIVSFSDDECYAISARHNGRAIGVTSATNSVPVQQNIWTNSTTQIWKIKKQDDYYFKVESLANMDKVLDVSGASTNDGAKVIVHEWSKANNQKWNITRNLGGFYSLQAKHSDLMLSIPDVNGYPGFQAAQKSFNSQSHQQQWVISIANCPFYADRRSISYGINAHRDGNKALINWYSELDDVAYFELERMNSNSQKFELIGKIDNNKTGSDIKTYATEDEHPILGENAYRIIAYTSNGTRMETDVKVLDFTNLDVVNVYPNPTQDVVNVDLSKFAKIPATIYFYDSFGRTIYTQDVDGQTERVQFDVSNFQSGRYLIRVAADGQNGITKQVVILRQ